MFTIAPPQSSQQPASQPTEPHSCQAIAFQIAGHWLALPHTALLQVVHQTALNRDVGSETLVYLGKQPLSILNLRPLLAAVPTGRSRSQDQLTAIEAPFLVIAALDTTLVGIPVDQPPILLELPLTATYAVPPAYYNAIRGIASHVVAVPQLGAVLLLNLQAATSGV
ncbi:MAG: hypothetical protein KME45_19060 [Stenomitos rutilans HA7619-LM2]|jgi:hypothetical protein|nr:hypothetical protein [Stenomitos rutilans HA7619-LM2]